MRTHAQSRRTSERKVLASVNAVLSLLVLWVLFTKLLGSFSVILVPFVLPSVLVLSGLIILGWSAWQPRSTKSAYALVCLLAGAVVVMATTSMGRGGDGHFFESRRVRLEELTRDLIAYGRIHEMCDGLRHFKTLNGELVAYTPAQVDTTPGVGGVPTLPVEQVLAREGIDRRRYEEFQHRLRKLRFIEVEVEQGYVAYLYDGILDNQQGYLLVRPGHVPPPLGSGLFAAELIALQPLGGGWYLFATT